MAACVKNFDGAVVCVSHDQYLLRLDLVMGRSALGAARLVTCARGLERHASGNERFATTHTMGRGLLLNTE